MLLILVISACAFVSIKISIKMSRPLESQNLALRKAGSVLEKGAPTAADQTLLEALEPHLSRKRVAGGRLGGNGTSLSILHAWIKVF